MNVSDEWVLTHRVDLHNALRSTAAKAIDNRKIDIKLSSQVLSVVSRLPNIDRKWLIGMDQRMQTREKSCSRMGTSTLVIS